MGLGYILGYIIFVAKLNLKSDLLCATVNQRSFPYECFSTDNTTLFLSPLTSTHTGGFGKCVDFLTCQDPSGVAGIITQGASLQQTVVCLENDNTDH